MGISFFTYPYHSDRDLAIQPSSRDNTWSLPRTNMTSIMLGPIWVGISRFCVLVRALLPFPQSKRSVEGQ